MKMHNLSLWRIGFPLLLVFLVCTVLAVRPAQASVLLQTTSVPTTPIPTLGVDERPDSCEPNNAPEQSCVLTPGTVSPTFTFLPDGDVDYYSINLGEQGAGTTTISVRGTSGLDLLTTINRAGETVPLTTISSPAISTTLAVNMVGWVVIRVENRAPESTIGETYRIEIRTAPAGPTPTASASKQAPVAAPDVLENNYDVSHASPVAIDAIYDLNFTCPVLGACGGGDHDYLRVPVKAGVIYLFATFDLGPGVDTVINVFSGDEAQPVGGNDDFSPGGLLSLVQYRASANDEVIVRVGPRNGGMVPIVADEDEEAGTYRFVVALASSRLADDILETVRSQSNAPTPTSIPQRVADVAATSAGESSYVPSAPITPSQVPTASDAPTGRANVIAGDGTPFREAPNVDSPIITNLPPDAFVTLLGQASGAWVRVQPDDSVVPGWVYGPALRRNATSSADGAPNSVDQAAPDATKETDTSGSLFGLPTPIRESEAPIALTITRAAVEPTLTPIVEPRVSLALVIKIQDDATTPKARAGIRVQLVNALGDVLTEVVSDSAGTAKLTRDIPAGTIVALQVPSAGLSIPLDMVKPQVTITIPTGATR